MYPICGPTPTTRDSNGPTRSPLPLSPVSWRSDEPLLREELRRAPVQMEVDAVLVVGIWIDIVVGEASNRRKLVSGLGVEVGVAGAAIERIVSDPDIRQAGSIVLADR